MNQQLKEAITEFCDMLPNINDLHHPNDECRLMQVIYLMRQQGLVFSDLVPLMNSELSRNSFFSSNDEGRLEFIREDVEPEAASMSKHLGMLEALELLR